MEIRLSLNKSVNDNANLYFEKSKKLKSKLPGVDETIEKTQKEIDEFEEKKETYILKKQTQEKIQTHKKKEWYEKFRYTKTTSGFLCVLGKDSGTNEILIKKHLEKDDIVIHTQASGSPFCIIKNAKDSSKNNKVNDETEIYNSLKIPKEEIEEAAQITCCFSSQWKKGFGTADAFWVYPEQVSKKAVSGEYMTKGAFMIYGQKNIIKNIQLRICLGVIKNTIKTEDDETIEYEELFSGSEKTCKKICNRFIKLEPGNQTLKSLNKEIKKQLKTHIEDLPKYIPNNCKILKK
ncbi:MAG: DUF814 domain-containing protein [Candidatus Woesearchaeota archaeon]|jgi:predicted ribosome quality control (RQC) complex YloA/Tae2 family protein|nr:DUF814 domain-containing protein [Candidatus Woesearchaeota archaeon]